MRVVKSQIGFCVGIASAYDKMNKFAEKTGPFTATHSEAVGQWDTLLRIEKKDPLLLQRYPHLDSVSVVYSTEPLQLGDRVVLGFHGLPRNQQADLKARGVNIEKNLHCPFIAKMDRVAETLASEGYDLFIVGTPGTHHVVDAQHFAEAHGRTGIVVERVDDVERLIPEDAGDRKYALIGQVTGNTEVWGAVVARVKELALPVKVVETVCSDSYLRQDEARDIASTTDVVVVVPGKAARAVIEVAGRANARLHTIDGVNDIRPEWFEGVESVGVLGGITVPQWVIDEVAAHIERLSVAPAEVAAD